MQDAHIEKACRYCEHLARNHYENFPVASRLLPKRLRRPIAVIYAFARTADDIADEGHAPAEQRLRQLEAYGQQLEHSELHDDPVLLALNHIIQSYDLPRELFHDLLTAFKMDVTQTRYRDFSEVLSYCRYSANPIGRLLLHLNHRVSADTVKYADAICTALQLINFYQDLVQDYTENNRIYIPLDEMQDHGVTEAHFRSRHSDKAMQNLMALQIRRAHTMLLSGRQLGTMLPGRMGLELRMVIAGGLRICQKLQNHQGNVFARPRLNKQDWLSMFWHAAMRI